MSWRHLGRVIVNLAPDEQRDIATFVVEVSDCQQDLKMQAKFPGQSL